MLAFHDLVRKVEKWFRWVAILCVLTTMPQPAIANDAAADEPLLLEVQVNGHPTGKVGEFTLHGGTLLARRDELHDLGLRVTVSGASDDLIALSTLPGLTWRLDKETQTLYVKVPNKRLLPTVLQLNGVGGDVAPRTIESGTGVTLNYDLVGTIDGGANGASGALNLQAFSPKGVVTSGLLVHAGADPSSSTSMAVRLDSTYQFADTNTLRRYSVGDFITGGLAWTRPVRLAGVQIRSDFSMRPDLVTFPLPSLIGSAAVPSTVDVLVNGNLVLSGQVAPGPFEVPQLPVITGAGNISMTVTNALGQQINVTQPFYASSALLARGLQTFSAQTGAVRRNWGVVSNDYGKLAGIANYRRGLTSTVTVEGSVEGTPGTVMAGGGGVVNVNNLGVLNVAAAVSIGSGRAGTQLSVGVQHIGRVFSLGGSATIAGPNFQDVAAINGDPVPRQQLNGNAGLSLRRFGSLGVAYAALNQDASSELVAFSATASQHSRVFSASYSVQVHRVSLYATEFRNFGDTGSSGLQVGVTIPFGRRSSVSVSGASDGSGQVQVQQSVARIGEWGYQAYVSAGNTSHEFVQAQYKSHWALLTAGIDENGGRTAARMESQGALSLVDGSLFPSNTIYDSFAIVDTGLMAHVHVLQENRDIGSTNSTGRLLVPDMRSFDVNHLAIEPTDIPLDATIAATSREVRPQDHSGVIIKFPMKVSNGALLQLVDEFGASVPVGSTAKLRETGVIFPIGYDGNAYVLDLNPHNDIDIAEPDGRRCTAAFDYHPMGGEIPSIGPLRCLRQRP